MHPKFQSLFRASAGVLLLAFTSFCAMGQEAVPPSDKVFVISKVAANQVSATTTAYTYKMENVAINDNPTDDVPQGPIQNDLINSIVAEFLAIEGVSRATFDPATKTITVVALSEAELPDDSYR